MKNNPLPRLDQSAQIRAQLLPHCRLRPGEVWEDESSGHRVGCMDATDRESIGRLMGGERASLAIHDPPYNVAAFSIQSLSEYISWCDKWARISDEMLLDDSSMYLWIGADQKNGFQPLPDFMVMMRENAFRARSLITMRNQRGYGTQKNWMAARQELLYYIKGSPYFKVVYTDIPKVLRGYYKEAGGRLTENMERGKSANIRASNVWVDIQQVFYRMVENVSGCYAQKPLKSIQRILEASSRPDDLTIDFFAHSGTTLLACEMLKRRCYTIDIDPVFAEITIRRLEQYRSTGRAGWQNGNPFEREFADPGHNGRGLADSEPLPSDKMPLQDALL